MTVAGGSLSAEDKVLLGLTSLTQKKTLYCANPTQGPGPSPAHSAGRDLTGACSVVPSLA